MSRRLTFGCTLPLGPPDTLLRYAALAEKSRYDSIWFPNHVVTTDPYTVCPDTWSVISAVGMKTAKVKLCDGVSDPYRTNPAVLALAAATVDQLTGGRVVVGLGAGEDMNLNPYGLSRVGTPSKRRQILREAIQVIRKLWDATVENPANFGGQFFRLRDAHLALRPKQVPHPPIYIGAMGPKTREMVGELADGYYPLVVNKELFPIFLGDIKRGQRKSGRKIDEIDCAARVFAAVSEDSETARRSVLGRAKRHLVLAGNTTLRALGVDVEVKGTIATMSSGMQTENYVEKLKSEIPDEVAETISIYGSVEECIEQVEAFVRVGATQLITFAGSEETIVNFGQVINYFREYDK